MTIHARKDTVGRIAETIADLIIEGTFRPRERLIETSLAQRFRASRAPVREALRLLESEGLVLKDARRGFSVTELSLDELRDLYEVFFVLEELYTRLAAPRMTPRIVTRLEGFVAEMERAARRGDHARYFDVNLQFHSTILEASANRFLGRLYRLLGRQTIRYRRIPLAIPERLRKSLQEHKQILQALQARDAELAGQRARQHAENAFRILERQLRVLSWLGPTNGSAG